MKAPKSQKMAAVSVAMTLALISHLTFANTDGPPLEDRLNFTIIEASPINSLVGRIAMKSNFNYSLNERNPYFYFDPPTGEIRTSTVLDRERMDSDRVDLVVLGKSPTHFILVRITVLDLNDNAPEFLAPVQNISLPESARIGTQLTIQSATDRDSGPNGIVEKYGIVSGNVDDKFKLVQSRSEINGENAVMLEVKSSLDYETTSLYALNISAQDDGDPPLSGFMTLFVNVKDENDNAPIFAQSRYYAAISEDSLPESVILNVSAFDLDSGENGRIRYVRSPDTSKNSPFSLDSTTGTISVKASPINCPIASCSETNSKEDSNNFSPRNANCTNGETRRCSFAVEAIDGGVPPQRNRAFVDIELIPRPKPTAMPNITVRYFPSASLDYAVVDERKPNGTIVAVLTMAVDQNFKSARLEIASGNEREDFRLDQNELFSLIRVNHAPDRTKISKYSLRILARDPMLPGRTSEATIVIFVANTSLLDSPLAFENPRLFANISESAPIGSYVASFRVKPQASTPNGPNALSMPNACLQPVYSIVSGNEMNWFSLNPKTGLLTTISKLRYSPDFETFTIRVAATCGKRTASGSVQIRIDDANTFTPSFTRSSFNLTITSETPKDSSLIKVKAFDNDTGLAGQVRYRIDETFQNGNSRLPFEIDENSGIITLEGELNRASHEKLQRPRVFVFNVVAYDLGTPSLSASAPVRICVRRNSIPQRQENSTIYPTEYFVNLLKNTQPGALILQLNSDDIFTGSSNNAITDGSRDSFDIEPATGRIFLRSLPPGRNIVDLSVTVTPSNDHLSTAILPTTNSTSSSFVTRLFSQPVSNLATKATQITVHIFIVDSPELVPRFSQPAYEFAIDEDPSTRLRHRDSGTELAIMGRPVGSVSATDPDRSGSQLAAPQATGVTYRIASGDRDEMFEVGKYSGELRAIKSLDRETTSSYRLTVVAIGRYAVASTIVNISVIDVNDNAPSFLYARRYESISIDRKMPSGYPVFSAEATDPDESFNGLVQYSLSPNSAKLYFFVDPNSGLLSLAQPAFLIPPSADSYFVNITASDFGNPPLSNTVSLTITLSGSNDSYYMEKLVFPKPVQNLVVAEDLPINERFYKVQLANMNSSAIFTSLDDHRLNAEKLGVFPDGWVYIRDQLDFESDSILQIQIVAADIESGEQVSDILTINVNVEDRNDNPPECKPQKFSLPENVSPFPPISIGQVSANDKDSGLFGTVVYSLASCSTESETTSEQSPCNSFQIDPFTGDIRPLVSFDRETFDKTDAKIWLKIIASDKGAPALSSECNVEVVIDNVNDNSPLFTLDAYQATIPENREIGSEILRVSATDMDTEDTLSYSIHSGNVNEVFSLDPASGILTVLKAVDRENIDEYKLVVMATDSDPSFPRNGSALVSIIVTDVNDNVPEFSRSAIIRNVSELTDVGAEVAQIKAIDVDSGLNAEIRYAIASGNSGNTFYIDPIDGRLILVKSLIYETIQKYRLIVSATNQFALPTLASYQNVTILVQDENNNAPQIPTISTIGQISEDAPVGSHVMVVMATDADSGENARGRFSIVSQRPRLDFAIDSVTGSLTTAGRLDREFADVYKLVIRVQDQPSNLSESLSSQRTINIIVNDVNDNAPELLSPSATVISAEAMQQPGYRITQLKAADPDAGVNGTVGFRLLGVNGFGPGGGSDLFDLTVDGSLYVKQAPQSPSPAAYHLQLEIYDRANDYSSNNLQLRTKLEFTVIPLSNQKTMLACSNDLYQFDLKEDLAVGVRFGNVSLTGREQRGSGREMVEFYVTGCHANGSDFLPLPVDIDRNSGALFLTRQLDFEGGANVLQLDVYALLVGGSTGQLPAASCKVKIVILDVNDVAPNFLEDTAEFEIAEDVPIGSRVGIIFAKDPDTTGSLRYDFVNYTGNEFAINARTGVISTSGAVDREISETFDLTVSANDGIHTSLLPVKIRLRDVNDNPPSFVRIRYDFVISEGSFEGAVIGAVKATDPDSGKNAEITYRLLAPDGIQAVFAMNPKTGMLTVVGQLDYEKIPIYELTVQATDNGQPQLNSTTKLSVHVADINDSPPVAAKSTLAFKIPEDSDWQTTVGQIDVSDADSVSRLYFKIASASDPFQQFGISSNGSIFVNRPLDREFCAKYQLEITAIDTAFGYTDGLPIIGNYYAVTAEVAVYIQDVNDCDPEFTSPMFATVRADANVGTVITTLKAVDPDEGLNGFVEYFLDPLDAGRFYSVDAVSGDVRILNKLNTNPKPISNVFNLSVWATDRGWPEQRKTKSQLIIEVVQDDSKIKGGQLYFQQTLQQVSIAENAIVGQTVARIEATGNPNGGIRAIPYFWIGSGDPYGDLELDQSYAASSNSNAFAEIRLAKPLDVNRMASYELSIRAAYIGARGGFDPPKLNSNHLKAGEFMTLNVNITDANIYKPSFLGSPYSFQVMETFGNVSSFGGVNSSSSETFQLSKFSKLIGVMPASDFDRGENTKISYSIIQGNTSVFSIDSTTAELRLNAPLDREQQSSYLLVVTATDSGLPRLTGTGTVTIDVLDLNDNPPVFDQPYYQANASEDSLPGTILAKVNAIDPDLGNNGRIKFSLAHSEPLPFDIDTETGELSVIGQLNYRSKSGYSVRVIGSDSPIHGRKLTAETFVRIKVLPSAINKHDPVFTNPQRSIFVPNLDEASQHIRQGPVIYVVSATDADNDVSGQVEYSLKSSDGNSFDIDAKTGAIRLRRAMPAFNETSSAASIEVVATDLGSPPRSTTLPLQLSFMPANQFPHFNKPPKNVSALEGVTAEVATVVAISRKPAPLNRMRYGIASGNFDSAFQIDQNTGKVYATEALDRERFSEYDLWISASDSDVPPLTSFELLEISVIDANDNPPEFTSPIYYASIVEEEDGPIELVTVKAFDVDSGPNAEIEYSFVISADHEFSSSPTSGTFEIDPESGLITARDRVDRERVESYRLMVKATNKAADAHSRFLSDTALVQISVQDINDNSPKFTRLFHASISEDAPIGASVTQVTSNDADADPQNRNNTYYLSSNPGDAFAIDSESGQVTVTKALDRETFPEYLLKIIATDGIWRVETSLQITLTDVNDCAPVFSQTTIYRARMDLDSEQLALSEILRLNATDADIPGPNSEINYHLLDRTNLYHLDRLTGSLKLTPAALDSLSTLENKTFTQKLIVVANDHGKPMHNSTAEIIVEFSSCKEPLPKSISTEPIHVSRSLLLQPATDESLPRFYKPIMQAEVSENMPAGAFVYVLSIADADGPRHVEFSIDAGNEMDLFSVNAKTGMVKTTASLDYETQALHNLSVSATIKRRKYSKTITGILLVAVGSENEFAPQFESRKLNFSLNLQDPGLLVHKIVGRISATDEDSGEDGVIYYSLDYTAVLAGFWVDPQSGIVRADLTQLVRRLKNSILNGQNRLKIIAYASNRWSSTDVIQTNSKHSENFFDVAEILVALPEAIFALPITVPVLKFSQGIYAVTVTENTPAGSSILAISATYGSEENISKKPGESGYSPKSSLKYYIDSGNENDAFVIDAASGVLQVNSKLDRETIDAYFLNVSAFSYQMPLSVALSQVRIDIADQNDNAPSLWPGNSIGWVSENDLPDSGVMTLKPFDPDLPLNQGQFQYYLEANAQSSYFEIGRDSGVIRAKSPFDREKQSEYALKVQLIDGGQPQMTAVVPVLVMIRDVNDMPSESGRDLKTRIVLLSQDSIAQLPLVQLKPPDQDLVGSYSCDVRSRLDYSTLPGLRVDSNCWLAVESDTKLRQFSETSPELLQLTLNGSDGIHDPVNFTASIVTSVISNATLENSVDMIVSAAEPRIIASDLLPLLRSSVDSATKRVMTLEFISISEIKQVGSHSQPSAFSSNQFAVTVTLKYTNNGQPLPTNETAKMMNDWMAFQKASLQNQQRSYSSFNIESIRFDLCSNYSASYGVESFCKNGGLCQTSVLLRRDPETGALVYESTESEADILAYPILIRDRICECSSGFAGPRCELATNRCARNPCKNGGTCQFNYSSGKLHCQCSTGFRGTTCADDFNECVGYVKGLAGPCENGGYCENTIGSYACICMVGFAGRNCSDVLPAEDYCKSSPCLHGANCTSGDHQYSCNCPFGFSGRNCEIGSLGFTESSYLELPNNPASEMFQLSLEFATTLRNGLLFYAYDSRPSNAGDFAAVEIVDGNIRLSAQFGSSILDNVQAQRKSVELQAKASSGAWQRLQLTASPTAVSVSLTQCEASIPGCGNCPSGDISCQGSLSFDSLRVSVPGESVFLGGLTSITDLMEHASHLNELSFVGCIRNVSANGRALDQMPQRKQIKLLDYCPRISSASICESEEKCGRANACVDKWYSSVCVCKEGFQAQDCTTAKDAYAIQKGIFVEYKLKEHIRRKLLHSTAKKTCQERTSEMPNFDSLAMPRRKPKTKREADSFDAEHWLNIELRTTALDSLLFFSASGPDFTVVDIVNGTLRYSSKTSLGELTILLDQGPTKISDGEWHSVSLALDSQNNKIAIRANEFGKELQPANPVHELINANTSELSLGGNRNQIAIYGQKLKSFDGCLSRFIFDGILQPLSAGDSELFDVVTSGGIPEPGCGGRTPHCSFPPCFSSHPLPSKDSTNSALTAVLVFFGCLTVVTVLSIFGLKKFRNYKKLKSSQQKLHLGILSTPTRIHGENETRTRLTAAATKISRNVGVFANFLGIRKEASSHAKHWHADGLEDTHSMQQTAFQTTRTSNTSLITGGGSQFSLLESLTCQSSINGSSRFGELQRQQQQTELQQQRSNALLGELGTLATPSSFNNGTIRNFSTPIGINPSPERYDLDNASSIAPSDVDTTYHYNKTFRAAANIPPVFVGARRGSSGNTTATVASLQTPVRNFQDPSSSSGLQSKLDGSSLQRRKRPESSRSRNSRRKSERRSSGRSSLGRQESLGNYDFASSQDLQLTVKDLQRNRMSRRSRRSGSASSSSSSSSGNTSKPRLPALAPRRPPKSTPKQPAPPVPQGRAPGDSSSTEVASERGVRIRSSASDSQQRKGLNNSTAKSSDKLFNSSICGKLTQPSEDETTSEAGAEGDDEEQQVPDLSNFVNRNGDDFKMLLTGRYSNGYEDHERDCDTPLAQADCQINNSSHSGLTASNYSNGKVNPTHLRSTCSNVLNSSFASNDLGSELNASSKRNSSLKQKLGFDNISFSNSGSENDSKRRSNLEAYV